MPEEKHQDQEFELIPVSPLRRLEKRLDELEQQSSKIDAKGFYKELVDIIRMNQQLVDELAKANDALRIELSRLPGRIEELVSKVGELVSFIKSSATEETEVPVMISENSFKPLQDKVQELVELNKKILEKNESMVSSLEELDRKMKKPTQPLPPMQFRKPLFPPKPL